MTDASVVAVVLTACTAAVYIVRTAAVTVLKGQERRLRAQEASFGAPSDERMARIEMAVESIAVEVERISEGQRFTTKLLNEVVRQPTPILEKTGRINTPH
jgi:hypothetical protein